MIDSVAGSAVSEVAAEDVPIWAAALPAAARAAACGAAAVPGDEDAVEVPAEHPAASRHAPPSNAPDATAHRPGSGSRVTASQRARLAPAPGRGPWSTAGATARPPGTATRTAATRRSGRPRSPG